jgi:hypothetical protein
MKLIFLYGMPATGKLTVARELASITGYKLFHNHLAVDLLLSLFEFGSPPFVVAREEIWFSVFEQAARAQTPGLIFTFAPEATVRPSFIPEVIKKMQNLGADVDFFELTCPIIELKRRLGDSSRSQYQKLTSISLFEELHAAGSFEAISMPSPRLSIDTSTCTPARAALQIARSLEQA